MLGPAFQNRQGARSFMVVMPTDHRVLYRSTIHTTPGAHPELAHVVPHIDEMIQHQ
jgi:hypothetical protein